MSSPFTPAQADALKDALAEQGGLVLSLALEEIRTLQARVAELEQRAALIWAGPFKEERRYKSGDCVQAQGSLWMAVCDSQGARPGRTPNFRLMVKSGAFKDKAANGKGYDATR